MADLKDAYLLSRKATPLVSNHRKMNEEEVAEEVEVQLGVNNGIPNWEGGMYKPHTSSPTSAEDVEHALPEGEVPISLTSTGNHLTTKEIEEAVQLGGGNGDPNKATDERSLTSETINESLAEGGFSDEEANASITSPNKGHRNLNFLFIALFILAGCTIGLLFGLGVISFKDDADTESFGTPTEAPGPWVPIPQPTPKTTPAPTPAPPTSPPSSPQPTTQPTQPPTESPLLGIIKPLAGDALNDPESPQSRAYELLVQTWADEPVDSPKLQQRYAMLTMSFSLSEAASASEMPTFVSEADECDWPVVECESSHVTKIHWTRRPDMLTGVIPPQVELLSSLKHLDLSENSIKGSIPDEMYQLSEMRKLYLEHNDMTGILSESISNWFFLEEIYLGNNRFSGPIPRNIKSQQGGIRPLRYISFHHNQFNGTIPSGLRLRRLFYLDLSFNQLTGELPDDIDRETFRKLRHLYLHHNKFSGTIPESYPLIGNGRLIDFTLNDNELTGGVPPTFVDGNTFLLTLNVQHNKLTEELDDNICDMEVFTGGELVQLGADCEICTCKNFCGNCY